MRFKDEIPDIEYMVCMYICMYVSTSTTLPFNGQFTRGESKGPFT